MRLASPRDNYRPSEEVQPLALTRASANTDPKHTPPLQAALLLPPPQPLGGVVLLPARTPPLTAQRLVVESVSEP